MTVVYRWMVAFVKKKEKVSVLHWGALNRQHPNMHHRSCRKQESVELKSLPDPRTNRSGVQRSSGAVSPLHVYGHIEVDLDGSTRIVLLFWGL